MGLGIFALIALAAVVIGVAAQLVMQKDGWAWLLIAAAITFGAYFVSETLPASSLFESIKDWGPQLDGFYLIPGAIGAAVLGLLAYVGTQTASLTTG
jgi:hypothetical protein